MRNGFGTSPGRKRGERSEDSVREAYCLGGLEQRVKPQASFLFLWVATRRRPAERADFVLPPAIPRASVGNHVRREHRALFPILCGPCSLPADGTSCCQTPFPSCPPTSQFSVLHDPSQVLSPELASSRLCLRLHHDCLFPGPGDAQQ